jgi:hypothetical protein
MTLFESVTQGNYGVSVTDIVSPSASVIAGKGYSRVPLFYTYWSTGLLSKNGGLPEIVTLKL